jgi:steroid 5-alpha reductase family enzyme
MLSAVAIAFVGMCCALLAVWVYQRRTRNAGMVDPVWAAALAGVAVLAASLGTGDVINRVFVGLAGGIWGLRLAVHLWRRNYGKPEDARYRQFREQWGSSADRNMFWFFQLQGVIAMLLAVAFFVPAFNPHAPAPLAVVIATLIWLAAAAGEASADRQLRRFTADAAHRGEVCQVGWWRYSRHPNYFFECVHWCAYPVLAFGAPWAWATLLPPLLMAWLLLKVSGIPLLEAHLMQSRPAYKTYMQTTSALIPWPPKKTVETSLP